MPLPLFLGIAAAVAAAGGIGTGVHGAVKMKEANDTVKSAEERHKKNVKRFETCNTKTTKSMDTLGKLELEILASFKQFSDLFEQIQNRPSFKEFACDAVDLPTYDPEELSKVSVGAGVLMGGIGGAALGTAGGFAAAGATTAAVMALGTASTGTAIASLSGAAATNATLAALGGGAVAAGGGGIALGTTMLGVTTLGVGLLVGGVIFSITGSSLSSKADKAYGEMLLAEKEIDKICRYLNQLNKAAKQYNDVMANVNGIYRRHLNALDAIININKKNDWLDFTQHERLVTQNAVLLVQLLYKMCQVKLVLKADAEGGLNKVNQADVDENIKAANTLVAERGFEGQKATNSDGWKFDEQESYGVALTALLYYFARCDHNISPEEAAVIENFVSPIVNADFCTEDMLAEINVIKEIKLFTFSNLKKYLEHVSVDVLNDFSILADRVISASDGISSIEKQAKFLFEVYVKERKANG